VDFDLSEEQKILKRTVREFAAAEIPPRVGALERHGTFPMEIIRSLAYLGILGGFALTEPSAGSDAAAMKARAERKGYRYLLDGTKSWITNVRVGGVYVLMGVTDPARGARRLTGEAA